ncbi:MAG: farnesyl diphosphate synthase [Luteimonas sp.]
MPETAAVQQRLDAWRQRVDRTLDAVLPSATDKPQRLHAAMRHAVLSGGKRVRPLLVYATGAAFSIDDAALDAPAAAVELIHAYSLIHDDLPAMDDDALRRGQPTVHVAYDEATAILAGDALQALAFETLASTNKNIDASARIAMCGELARAAGTAGMCGGQALDIEATGASAMVDLSALERLHARKTGALLRASVRFGAIAADADDNDQQRLDRFADALGLAFQIRDDLLDVEGDSATLGKTAGKDATQGKATFPGLIGIEASRLRLYALSVTMRDTLEPFGARADALRAIAHRVVVRDR